MQSPISPFVKDTILLLAAKRTMLRKEKDAIDTLVLGSSHGDFGFNPAFYPKSFNLCFRSLDLKHSFHLFEKISSTHPSIRNLVLFYSAFSPGSFMEKSTSEKVISPPMSEVFGLNLAYEDESLKEIADCIKGELENISVDIDGLRGFFPDSAKGFMPESYTVEKRASDHYKLNQITHANAYLTRLLDLAAQQRQKVCVVIPPVRSDYRAAIGVDANELFKSLFDILNSRDPSEGVQVINCHDDTRFIDQHFGDYDHLHPHGKGVEILTKSILKKMGGETPNLYSSSLNMNVSTMPLAGSPLPTFPFNFTSHIASPKK